MHLVGHGLDPDVFRCDLYSPDDVEDEIELARQIGWYGAGAVRETVPSSIELVD